MTLDLSHLTAPTRELAFQDTKARIRLVQTARWVAYPRAGVAVDELERRFNYPTCARMPCMLLYGDSGMGKSMILEKMERQHPSSYSIPGSSRYWEHPTPATKSSACWRPGSSIC
jgi:Bacterial TniB protein